MRYVNQALCCRWLVCDPIIIQRILTDLELLVEQDTLGSGTINMAMPHRERIIMWAKTRDFGDLEVQYGL